MRCPDTFGLEAPRARVSDNLGQQNKLKASEFSGEKFLILGANSCQAYSYASQSTSVLIAGVIEIFGLAFISNATNAEHIIYSS